jgi:uncharacterized protein YbjT (DUF2867 family)
MAQDKIIAIVGATGAQGGGLARAILDDPDSPFRARAITRNAGSDKAQELARRGAEVVEADLDDPESLKRAFAGAHGAYCVTNFWEHFSPGKEVAQAVNMAEAARAAGLAHVIWSTLEDTRQWVPLDDTRMPTLMEKYKVPHFDGKGEANREFTNRGVPTTFLLTSFYWDNLIQFGMGPRKGPDGVFAITFPMGDRRLPGIAVEDIGKCAYGIFRRGARLRGQDCRHRGRSPDGRGDGGGADRGRWGWKCATTTCPPRSIAALGFPGAEDLGNMFQFKRDFNDYFCGIRNVDEARALNPELQDFDEWLVRNKERMPLE